MLYPCGVAYLQVNCFNAQASRLQTHFHFENAYWDGIGQTSGKLKLIVSSEKNAAVHCADDWHVQIIKLSRCRNSTCMYATSCHSNSETVVGQTLWPMFRCTYSALSLREMLHMSLGLGSLFFHPHVTSRGSARPLISSKQINFFIRESILAQQQAISKTLASSDILTVWYKTNFIFCCENPYSPPSVSPPTAANRAGTSDWSRCPSPGRSSPLGILCSSICLRRQRDSERSTRATMRRWMALQFPLETGRLEIDLLSQNNFVSRMKTCVTDTACLQKMQQSSLVTMYNSEIRTVKDSWNTLGKNKVPIQSLSSLAGPNNFLSWKRPPTSSVGRLVVRPAVAFATLM